MEIKTKDAYGLASYSVCHLTIWDAKYIVDTLYKFERVLKSHNDTATKKEYLTDEDTQRAINIFQKIVPEGIELGRSSFEEEQTQKTPSAMNVSEDDETLV